MSLYEEIETDIWDWIHNFVAVPNAFYGDKFPPCPYAKSAILAKSVDVLVWKAGDVRSFIQDNTLNLRANNPALTTRVMAFPPKTQWLWGLSHYVEQLNAKVISDNIFLNTGVAKTTISRYPQSSRQPYFVVIANSLDAVLKGAEALQKTNYYNDWPQQHYELVVLRRARMAKIYTKRSA